MALNRPASQNKYTPQNMGNTSFDEDFGVNAVEMLVYNASASTLDRMVQPTFSGDIQISAVEIKNSTDDTRAKVGANGLEVDVRNIQTGTNSIGKISDITTSVTPGTGITNLGKAQGQTCELGDVGVVVLGKRRSELEVAAATDGQYGRLSITDYAEVRTRDQRAVELCDCDVTTGWSVLNNDTSGLATTTNHIYGTAALTFDKVNGAADTLFGCIQKNITPIALTTLFASGGFVGLCAYLPSLTNVTNVFLRVGTDSTNYNCWTWAVTDLTAGQWLNLRKSAAQPDYSRNAGNGWNPAVVTYVAVGVEFNSSANTMAGIVVDHAHVVGGRVTSSDINATIASSVTTPNVNILKVGSTVVDTNNGAASAGTMRVTMASDSTGQVKLAAGTAEIGNVKNAGTFAVQESGAALTALQLIDNMIAGSEARVDVITMPTVTVNSHAVTNAGTFATQTTLQTGSAAIGKLTANSGIDIGDVGHNITGVGHGVKVVTTAGTDVALAASTPCKRVTIQAQLDNTSTIAVGATGVDATVATGTGIVLNPGDVFEFDIDNLADVFIDSLVNGEGVRFQYLT